MSLGILIFLIDVNSFSENKKEKGHLYRKGSYKAAVIGPDITAALFIRSAALEQLSIAEIVS